MLSHLGVRFYGLNIGVFAVVIFYILAGYVVSNLYLNIIPKSSGIYGFRFSIINYKLFIVNRVNRIFPLYIYMALLTTIFLLITDYGKPHFSLFNIFTNFTIIPLNFYMWIDNSILTDPKWWLIPPAWSLGTELQAYILLPFAIFFPKFRYFFIILSFIIFTIANLNIIHPDYYGYRLIVGVFFIFMLGVSIRNIKLSKYNIFDIYFPILVWIGVVFLLFIIFYLNVPIKAYVRETSFGILIGLPIVYILSKRNSKIVFDKTLGLLSYAIFLSHFLVIWIFDYLCKLKIIEFDKLYFVIILTFIISFLGIFVESRYNFLLKNVEKM
jgi:peptidoglycan/LPS O-acetylase OafA/YrhL